VLAVGLGSWASARPRAPGVFRDRRQFQALHRCKASDQVCASPGAEGSTARFVGISLRRALLRTGACSSHPASPLRSGSQLRKERLCFQLCSCAARCYLRGAFWAWARRSSDTRAKREQAAQLSQLESPRQDSGMSQSLEQMRAEVNRVEQVCKQHAAEAKAYVDICGHLRARALCVCLLALAHSGPGAAGKQPCSLEGAKQTWSQPCGKQLARCLGAQRPLDAAAPSAYQPLLKAAQEIFSRPRRRHRSRRDEGLTLEQQQKAVQDAAFQRYLDSLRADAKKAVVEAKAWEQTVQGGMNDEATERLQKKDLCAKNQAQVLAQIENNKARRAEARREYIEAASSHSFPLFTETFISLPEVEEYERQRKEHWRMELDQQMATNKILQNLELKKHHDMALASYKENVKRTTKARREERQRLASQGRELVASWERDIRIKDLRRAMEVGKDVVKEIEDPVLRRDCDCERHSPPVSPDPQGVVARLIKSSAALVGAIQAQELPTNVQILKDQLGSMKIGDSVVFKVAQNQLGIPQVSFARKLEALTQERQRLMEVEAPLPAPGTPESDVEYLGFVTSFQPELGFGFLSCAQTRQLYGQEVVIHRDQFTDLNVSDGVHFKVALNAKHQPIARKVRKAGGDSQSRVQPAAEGRSERSRSRSASISSPRRRLEAPNRTMTDRNPTRYAASTQLARAAADGATGTAGDPAAEGGDGETPATGPAAARAQRLAPLGAPMEERQPLQEGPGGREPVYGAAGSASKGGKAWDNVAWLAFLVPVFLEACTLHFPRAQAQEEGLVAPAARLWQRYRRERQVP
ncbi:unnamed protein product, partial [Symbiodinium necroappetens]